jgi:hypothetical protein
MIMSILRLFRRPSPEETARELLRELLLHLDEVEPYEESAPSEATVRLHPTQLSCRRSTGFPKS